MIGIRLSPEAIVRLDQFAKSQGLTRSAAVRALVERALASRSVEKDDD